MKPNTAEVLKTVEPFVRNAVRRHVPEHEREDAAQNIRLHLLQTAIPAYRPERGSIRTFLWRVIENHALEQARQLGRQRKPHPIEDIDRPAPDTSLDHAVEQLAALILDDPDQHMTASKARVIRAVTDFPDASGAELADMLGLSVNSVWPALSRIKSEIARLLDARVA